MTHLHPLSSRHNFVFKSNIFWSRKRPQDDGCSPAKAPALVATPASCCLNLQFITFLLMCSPTLVINSSSMPRPAGVKEELRQFYALCIGQFGKCGEYYSASENSHMMSFCSCGGDLSCGFWENNPWWCHQALETSEIPIRKPHRHSSGHGDWHLPGRDGLIKTYHCLPYGKCRIQDFWSLAHTMC